MTIRLGAAGAPPGRPSRPAGLARPSARTHWLGAAVETSRPRQWPKNLLVFAAPLAGASLGRDEGLGYALVAAAAFTAASAAVYFVNDVADADRDRRHPHKRSRAVASGRLPVPHALALAALAVAAAEATSLAIGEPRLAALIAAYVAFSCLYTLALKHVPVIELVFVAAGFVLRALGGAAATHVAPSAWFLVVCSLGALMVAIAKRFTELAVLGADATRHRPVMRWYTPAVLRLGQRMATIVMIAAYVLWAAGEHGGWMRGLHLASAVPVAAALVRFDWLTTHMPGKPVEDLIARDGSMICCQLVWLVLFVAGL
jgi:decaprenyl-phosphate phosphoribosyltransferase